MNGLQHTRPLSLGLAAAALVPVVLVAGYTLVAGLIAKGNIFISLIVGFFGLSVSLPSVFLLGAPYVLLMRRLAWLNAATVCFGASLFGAVGLWVLDYHLSYFPAAGERAHHMAMNAASGALLPGACLGLVAGLSMCLVSGVRWRSTRQA
jgi:hypothetical protein